MKRKPLILREKQNKRLPEKRPQDFLKGQFPATFCYCPGEQGAMATGQPQPSVFSDVAIHFTFGSHCLALSRPRLSLSPAAPAQLRLSEPVGPPSPAASLPRCSHHRGSDFFSQNLPGTEVMLRICGLTEPPPQPCQPGTTIVTPIRQRARLRSPGPRSKSLSDPSPSYSPL